MFEGTADRLLGHAETAPFGWARQYFEYVQTSEVSRSPWASTYLLTAADKSAYLKVLPSGQRSIVPIWQQLSVTCTETLPRLLAADSENGWLLSADHEARELDYEASTDDLCRVLRAYAKLQGEVSKDLTPFAIARSINRSGLVQQLFEFLGGSRLAPDAGGQVDAAYFLSTEEAASYSRQFERHKGRLMRFLADAPSLPPTLNHGDLRPPNTAIRDDGSVVLLDWDDLCLGPAGMSLHGLFGGCVKATLLLGDSPVARAASHTREGQMISAYVDALASTSYADKAVLRKALPSSMCAGLIQFILDFGSYPGEQARSGVAYTMSRRLEDLLDLCDWMTTTSREAAVELAQFYESEGRHERAQALYRDQLARNRQDPSLVTALARTCMKLQEWEDARECFEELLIQDPRQTSAHLGIGLAERAQMNLEQAEQHLSLALRDPSIHDEAQRELTRLHDLRLMRLQAAEPDTMPRLRLTAAQGTSIALTEEDIALGAELFRKHGVLQIDNAFSTELILQLQAAFFARYAAYFKQDNHPDALYLGDKRYMLTIDMSQPFDENALVEAPAVLPIVRRLLGDDCVLGAFTAVISLPGSRDQDLHKDHPALFPDTDYHFTLPPFATQIIVPLVPLNEWTGTTRFFKGSHLVPTEEAFNMPHQDPKVPLGSCLLMDYRCAHHGLGNRSDAVRPILTLIYNRPWFRDYRNYSRQPPLRFDEHTFASWSEDKRDLVHWWREERRIASLAHVARISEQAPALIASASE